MIVTNVISIGATHEAQELTIHLPEGEKNGRRLAFVPINNGSVVRLDTTMAAKIIAGSAGETKEFIGTVENGKAVFNVTENMTEHAAEYECTLIIEDEDENTLYSQEFTLLIHPNGWSGDVVVNNNQTLTEITFDEGTKVLTAVLANGETITADMNHGHALAVAEDEEAEPPVAGNDGFMSKEDKGTLDTLGRYITQPMSTTDYPTFRGVILTAYPDDDTQPRVVIDGATQTISGAVFE